MKKLIIVESPTKAKTISKMLPKSTKVIASKGHVRDLPKSRLGVDLEKFEPEYINVRGQGNLIKELKKEAKAADVVYLATDPDREGEAIAWHIAHILDINGKENVRVTFNEITKNAVEEALKKPRSIEENTVDAQQARRVLDRIVGYKISPILWKNVKSGLSAGRVQSVALKLVVDRERKINAFIPEEYWNLEMVLKDDLNTEFVSKFYGKDGKKQEIKSEKEVKEILDSIDTNNIKVKEIVKGTKKRNPAPPFITSTLQQTASNVLRFSTKKTMMVAQRLYEGVNIPKKGQTGLITYMRTDSTRIAENAMQAAEKLIKEKYGNTYYEKRYFRKSKNAQDAHEAIRPTSLEYTPEEIEEYLTSDEYKLYSLIYKRFLCSQMAPAVYDTATVKLDASTYEFRTNGSKINFDGFLKVYKSISDEDKNKDEKEDEDENVFPELKENEKVKFVKYNKEQKFTNPPARFTESTLVKTLEENGVGRPSTYAPIISTILSRKYVEKEGRQFKPTNTGFLVTEIMEKFFPNIVNIEFTANVEEKLDEIEEGQVKWKKLMENFYKEFEQELEKSEKELSSLELKEKAKEEVVESDIVCEKCGRKMVYKESRYGRFLACPGYPACKNTISLDIVEVGKCPKCGGKVVERKSRRGYKFYICENNKGEKNKETTCDYISWNKPGEEKEKKTKK